MSTRWSWTRRGVALPAIAVLAALIAAPAVQARPPGQGRHGPPRIDYVLERHAERLGLDDALRARIRELAEAGREAAEPLHEKLSLLRDQMHALLSAEVPDERAVLAKAEEMGAVKTSLHKERLRTMLAIRKLLSPEQRRELVRIFEERREKRRQLKGWDDPPEDD